MPNLTRAQFRLRDKIADILQQNWHKRLGKAVAHAGNDDQFGGRDAFGAVLRRGHGKEPITVAMKDQGGAPDNLQRLVARRGRDDRRQLTRDAGRVVERAVYHPLHERANVRFAFREARTRERMPDEDAVIDEVFAA